MLFIYVIVGLATIYLIIYFGVRAAVSDRRPTIEEQRTAAKGITDIIKKQLGLKTPEDDA